MVLINSGPNTLLSPDLIGEHIRQRLSGEPAISLDTVLVPATRGFRGVLRSFGAYWFTMLAAGVFIYGAVLGVQGLAALILPRRLFLRLSGYLQLAAICVIVGVYFLQPGFGGLDDLTIGSIWRAIQWLPSYWFLALYQQLNGSLHPALEPLARRAWIGLAAWCAARPWSTRFPIGVRCARSWRNPISCPARAALQLVAPIREPASDRDRAIQPCARWRAASSIA